MMVDIDDGRQEIHMDDLRTEFQQNGNGVTL
jgi:hypothetical protein